VVKDWSVMSIIIFVQTVIFMNKDNFRELSWGEFLLVGGMLGGMLILAILW
jgi:hypothetical protein